MATATEFRHGLGGYDGEARAFIVDPPLDGNDRVVVVVHQAWDDRNKAEAVIFPCDENAAATSTFRLSGSYVATTPTHEKALSLAGDYEIVQPEPE